VEDAQSCCFQSSPSGLTVATASEPTAGVEVVEVLDDGIRGYFGLFHLTFDSC
jgi:hypothetical protein